MTTALVLDKYGNNAAVRCGFCFRVFVVSQLLNKKNGRTCPHCSKDRITFAEDGQIQSSLNLEPSDKKARVRELLDLVRPIAAEFYKLTEKPLGVTGEIAEFAATDKFNLTLAPPRTEGFDALRGKERIQIKGRAYSAYANPSQRISRIKLEAACDTVMLVILNNETLELREIWEAPYKDVCDILKKSGSKARDRGSLGIPAFQKIATKTWPFPS